MQRCGGGSSRARRPPRKAPLEQAWAASNATRSARAAATRARAHVRGCRRARTPQSLHACFAGSCTRLERGQLARRDHRPKEGLPRMRVPHIPGHVPGIAAGLDVGPQVGGVIQRAHSAHPAGWVQHRGAVPCEGVPQAQARHIPAQLLLLWLAARRGATAGCLPGRGTAQHRLRRVAAAGGCVVSAHCSWEVSSP